MRLAGKRVLVTGAARGIGFSIAERLSREGATVLMADIDRTACESAASELTAAGGTARAYALDVASESQWQHLVDQLGSEVQQLEGMVNNAGIEQTGPISGMSLAEWQKVMDVNLTGLFLGIRAMTPLLAAGAMATPAGASLVNLSSILGLVGFADASAYAASKGGVRLLTKSLAVEFAGAGNNIRVNSVHPGFIRTSMTEAGARRLASAGLAENMEAVFQQLAAQTPLGRIGQPADIANGVLFLLSDESSFMTGSELVMDGGYTAR